MSERLIIGVTACVTIVMILMGTTGLAQPACPIKPVTLAESGATVGDVVIELTGAAMLGEPRTPNRAMVWDEPMRLRRGGGDVCSVDPKVGIITAPVFEAGGRVLYVTTYSGSHSVLFAVNTANCKVAWESKPFRRGPYLSGHRFTFSGAAEVEIGSDCLPVRTGDR